MFVASSLLRLLPLRRHHVSILVIVSTIIFSLLITSASPFVSAQNTTVTSTTTATPSMTTTLTTVSDPNTTTTTISTSITVPTTTATTESSTETMISATSLTSTSTATGTPVASSTTESTSTSATMMQTTVSTTPTTTTSTTTSSILIPSTTTTAISSNETPSSSTTVAESTSSMISTSTTTVATSTTVPTESTTSTTTSTTTPAPPAVSSKGFYIVVDSRNLAQNINNVTVLNALKQDIARQFGILPSQVTALLPTKDTRLSSQVTIYFSIDDKSTTDVNRGWNQIKDNKALTWMNATRQELRSLGAPMSPSDSLVSALTEQQFMDQNKKPMGYCENPAICAGTVIGGIIAAMIAFYLLFRWQRKHLDDDEEGGGSGTAKYRFDRIVDTAAFDQNGTMGQDNENLERELSEMQVDPSGRLTTATTTTAATTSADQSPSGTSLPSTDPRQQLQQSSQQSTSQNYDPYADEFSSYFATQGFGAEGSGLRRKMPKKQAEQQSLGVAQLRQDMEFV